MVTQLDLEMNYYSLFFVPMFDDCLKNWKWRPREKAAPLLAALRMVKSILWSS